MFQKFAKLCLLMSISCYYFFKYLLNNLLSFWKLSTKYCYALSIKIINFFAVSVLLTTIYGFVFCILTLITMRMIIIMKRIP